jgi:hypothetical protein
LPESDNNPGGSGQKQKIIPSSPDGRQKQKMEENDNNNSDKIQSIRDLIYNTEKSLQAAKAMLLQLEGKKKVGRKRKSFDDSEEGKIIEGTFDGQIMLGTDGKQYPVPANYASKSKLIEGDMLKLTITPDGSFIYKQIGPAERKRLIGIMSQDADGNYFVAAEGRAYKVLLASVTYFKVEPGDEVTLVVPRDLETDWGSIENVLQKESHKNIDDFPKPKDIDEVMNDKPKRKTTKHQDILDEWAPDLEELKKELESDVK